MKKKSEKIIEITPHKSLMLKVGQTGYSLQEAVSELVDNSIDARFENRRLDVSIRIDKISVSIQDNGKGMSEKDAANSIRLGFSSKTNQLGEFGMGMKTASNFLGKRFTVVTSPQNSSNEYVITFDEDEWMNSGNWTRYPFSIHHEVSKKESGTTIIIEKLKVDFDERALEDLRKEITVRFAPFIRNNIVKIFINDSECQPIDPRIIGERHSFELSDQHVRITGWWAYQLQGLNKSCFGLNMFRRGRLITTFDKTGLNPNQTIKQIIGEVEVEGVPVAHDKKSWQKGTGSYKIAQSLLRKYFIDYEPRLKKILSGYPASRGIVEGQVLIMNMFVAADKDLEDSVKDVKPNSIIVTEMTRPQYLLAIRRAAGVITDLGGSLCHAAIVAREFDIPTVVGTGQATTLLKQGQKIILDADQGIVYEY